MERHQAGWKQPHIAAGIGISRKCVRTGIIRYGAEGETGLETRSSRPHTMPTRLVNPYALSGARRNHLDSSEQ